MLDDPLARDRPPTASRRSSPARRPPTASWRGPRWCCCGRRGRTRPCCRSRPRRTCALCVLGPLARPGPGGLARRLLEPRQPPPRAGDDAARRDQAALAGRDLCPRLRLRRRGGDRRAARGAPRGGGAGRAGRRTSCSSSASRTSGAGNRPRWPSRGCRYVQRRLVERVRRANPAAKLIVFVTAGRALHIPREVEANADAIFWTAHLGSFAGDAIADILAGVVQPDGAALARAADRRRDHLGLRHAAGAGRPAGGAGGGGLRLPAPAPPLVRLLSRPRRPLAGGLLLRRGLRLHLLRALRLVARPTARSPPRPARRSPPASG